MYTICKKKFSNWQTLHTFVQNTGRMVHNGKYALVTGAASGMGREYARVLGKMGYGIVAVDINAPALESFRAEMEKTGTKTHVICMDLTRKDAAAEIAGITDRLDAPVEILINNAGMIAVGFTTDMPSDKISAIMMLHCTTPLLLYREFIPRMEKAGNGYVLNISSICAWMDWPIIGMYGNTKRFVKGYSRSLRVEGRVTGSPVSITTAYFGAVDTPLFGFSDKSRRTMKRLGVMISPEKAVSKALDAMFRRKKQITPGILNKVAIPVVSLIPDWLLVFLVDKLGHLFLGKK